MLSESYGVSTIATDCLERPVSEMIYSVLSGTTYIAYSLTQLGKEVLLVITSNLS